MLADLAYPGAKNLARRPQRAASGLFDLFMVLLCLWAAYHHTPGGALLRRGGAWLGRGRSSAPPLLSYFQGGGHVPRSAFVLPSLPPRHLTEDESLALATSLAARSLSPSARRQAAGAELFNERRGEAAAAKLHAALRAQFPDPEVRLLALFAGREPARYAFERVTAGGGDLTMDALVKQLPPGFEDASEAARQAVALHTALGLAWPVTERAPITSPFGMRDHPVLARRLLHAGVDISLPEGSAVRAAGEGVVRRASRDAINGNVLVVDHGAGVTTAYCHNRELLVDVGATVERGTLIARSGNTGRSTGPHLHYQLELASEPVDPLRLRALPRAVASPIPP